MQSYVIHFIRHGMTEANILGKYAGIIDIPVCEKGFQKLKKLKNDFGYPEVKEIYTSPLKRCVQTSKTIYPNGIPIYVEGLKECNFGEWEGKSTSDLSSNPLYMQWIKPGSNITPPGGESWGDFHKRISETFEELVESMMRRGVTSASIFTHGGVIMTILSAYGLPKADFYDWIVDNGCGYSVRITPGLWMRDKVFEVYEKVPLGASGEIDGEFKGLIDNLSSKN